MSHPSKAILKASLLARSQEWQVLFQAYAPTRILGEGSFGLVVSAIRKSDGESVAIKHISNAFQDCYTARKAYRELALIRQLTAMGCESIAKLHDAVVGEDDLFLVMEHMTVSLDQALSNRQFVYDEEAVKKYFYEILCSLAYLHSAGVMHRDIKPSNFLLDEEGNLKLCDFGLARTTVAKDQAKPRWRLSNHISSRWYRAPEVILLEKHYDEAIDIWSAGCIFQEVLAMSSDYAAIVTSPETRYMFPGTSCFPLSPADEGEKEEEDQLLLIKDILGRQDPEDIEFVSSPEAAEYLKSLPNADQKIDFSLEFEKTDPLLTNIIQQSLEFNPQKRRTARKMMKQSVFDGVRDERLEKLATARIQLKVDQEGAYDYSGRGAGQKMSLAEIRKLICREAAFISQ